MFNTSLLRQLFSRNKRLIAGNWKSNKTYSEALDFVKNTINNIKFNPNNVGTYPLTIDVVISPVTLHIPAILALNPGNALPYRVAAQNCSNYGYGAYTG